MGVHQHISGRQIMPGLKTATKAALRARATGTVAAGNIVGCTGIQGAYLKANRASAAVAADCRGPLFMALGGQVNGGDFMMISQGVIENANTLGQTVGDAVYLSTAGGYTFVPTGFTRKIGVVAVVSATIGEILFDGGLAAGATIRVGIAAVVAATSVTITAATLTGLFGGQPVVATCATVSGTIHVTACTWSADDLVITFSASYTGNVYFMIGVA